VSDTPSAEQLAAQNAALRAENVELKHMVATGRRTGSVSLSAACRQSLRGQRLWRIEINEDQRRRDVVVLRRHLRPVACGGEVPSAIWISTTNNDNNGDGTADRILRSEIR
jgi:hypothetical protein